MSEEDFLSRWSRRKSEATQAPVRTPVNEALPPSLRREIGAPRAADQAVDGSAPSVTASAPPPLPPEPAEAPEPPISR